MSAEVPRVASVEVADAEAAQQEYEYDDDGMIPRIHPDSKDSNYHYRWCRYQGSNMSVKKAKGYEAIVHDPDDPMEFLSGAVTVNPEGYYQSGDLVLMRCLQKRHARRRENLAVTNEQRLGTGDEETLKLGRRTGLTVQKQLRSEPV